jgi:hypothetical protein
VTAEARLDSSWDKYPEVRDLLLRAIAAASAGNVREEEEALREAGARVNKTWFGSLPRKYNAQIDRLTAQGTIRTGARFLGRLGGTQFWDDRIVTEDGSVRLIDAKTRATVDTAGNISYAYGYDGIGGFRIGSTARYDDRELYLLVEHPEWQIVEEINPVHGKGIRALAAGINQAAARLETSEAPVPGTTNDVVERLKELTNLHDRGALTGEEFAAAKARLLGGQT